MNEVAGCYMYPLGVHVCGVEEPFSWEYLTL